jgi:chorismate synthase
MLRYMTAGESHGKGLVALIEGVPAGLKLRAEDIDRDLKRRMQGYGRGGRMAIESDRADIISGCRKGKTIGSPVGILIKNRDYKIDVLPDVFDPRPGHADLAGMMKYGFHDARDVLERASARETASRVALGAVAKVLLKEFGVTVLSHVISIGKITARSGDMTFDQIRKKVRAYGKLNCADAEAEKMMCGEIDLAAERGDTLGGSFEVMAEKVPPGLGSYVHWDRRMDAALARALMSIPAVKAVSIGRGIEASERRGSEVHDVIVYDKKKKSFSRSSNNAGGIEGGVTNGETVVIRGFMKPIATLSSPLATVNMKSKKASGASRERSDVCAAGSCAIVAEAVTAIEIAGAFTEKFGADSVEEMRRNYKGYISALKKM